MTESESKRVRRSSSRRHSSHMRPPAGSRGARDGNQSSDIRIAIGLVALAWVHRILFLLSNVDRSWGFSVFYEGDSETFYNYARAILAGTPYDAGIPFHPPLFPHLLSFLHVLVGAGDATARVPNLALKIVVALIGSIPIGLLYLVVRPYLGKTVALVGSLLTLYSFGQYVMSIAPVSEGLYSTLLLLSVLVWTKLAQRMTIGDRSKATIGLSITLGVIFGLLALTRAEGILPAVLLAGLLLMPLIVKGRHELSRTLRGILAPAGAIAGAMLLTLTPWTIRNAHHLSLVNQSMTGVLAEPLPEFVPITAYGPLNFALANHDGATGEFSREVLTSQRESAVLDVRDPQHLRYFLHGYEIGWDWIRAHPGDFAILVLKKWRLFFGALELGWTQWDLPGGLDGVRRPVDMFVPSSSLALIFTAPLLLLGAFLCTSSGSRLWRLADRVEPSREVQGDAPRADLAREHASGDRRRTHRHFRAATDGPLKFLVLVAVLTAASLTAAGLFFGYARLGVILLPFWYTLIGVALVWITSLIASRVRMSKAIPPAKTVMVVLALLFLLEAWGATSGRDFRATGTQAAGASHLNPHDTMQLELIRD